jgi:hypothetical protein
VSPTGDAPQAQVSLLLDEMHAPAVAAALQNRGHDVIAAAENPELRALTAEDLLLYAAGESRRIVTENVKDFRRLLLRAEEAGQPTAGVLFTSSRTIPRSRRSLGPLIDALHAWLIGPDVGERPVEDWLLGARSS